MKSPILLLALSAALVSSCTTAYKTGQTPDDVYFSPERPQDEYVRVNERDDRRYEGSDEYYEDRYLRMKVQNHRRWSDLDDYYYYNRYAYTSFGPAYYNNPWNPYNYWNYYYNPYAPGILILNPKTSVTYGHPRTVNLNTYNSDLLNNNYTNPKRINNSGNDGKVYRYNNSNSNSNRNTIIDLGRSIRDAFGNSNSSTNSSNNGNTNTRSSSSSSSSSENSSSNSSSAPRRKF